MMVVSYLPNNYDIMYIVSYNILASEILVSCLLILVIPYLGNFSFVRNADWKVINMSWIGKRKKLVFKPFMYFTHNSTHDCTHRQFKHFLSSNKASNLHKPEKNYPILLTPNHVHYFHYFVFSVTGHCRHNCWKELWFLCDHCKGWGIPLSTLWYTEVARGHGAARWSSTRRQWWCWL